LGCSGLGAVGALAVLAIEHRLRASSATALLGGAVGGLLALWRTAGAIVISGTSEPESTSRFSNTLVCWGLGTLGNARRTESCLPQA